MKKVKMEWHHTIPLAENLEWHLANLWETPGSLGGYRTMVEIPKREHKRRHKLKRAKTAVEGLTDSRREYEKDK